MSEIENPYKLGLAGLHSLEKQKIGNLSKISKFTKKQGFFAKPLNIVSYIYLYKMLKPHSPTLESVIMVEKTIQKHSQECGKYQLWKKLPKKMMYQTFQTILDYLEKSGKIMIDKEGIVIWTYNPKRIKKLISEGLIAK